MAEEYIEELRKQLKGFSTKEQKALIEAISSTDVILDNYVRISTALPHHTEQLALRPSDYFLGLAFVRANYPCRIYSLEESK